MRLVLPESTMRYAGLATLGLCVPHYTRTCKFNNIRRRLLFTCLVIRDALVWCSTANLVRTNLTGMYMLNMKGYAKFAMGCAEKFQDLFLIARNCVRGYEYTHAHTQPLLLLHSATVSSQVLLHWDSQKREQLSLQVLPDRLCRSVAMPKAQEESQSSKLETDSAPMLASTTASEFSRLG